MHWVLLVSFRFLPVYYHDNEEKSDVYVEIATDKESLVKGDTTCIQQQADSFVWIYFFLESITNEHENSFRYNNYYRILWPW